MKRSVTALALWAALLPLVTIHVCYGVAAMLDHVPLCLPYVTGCTSTSSTGRALPESLLFRAGMIPSAVLVLLFWQRCADFLRTMGGTGTTPVLLRAAGVVAAAFLILYTVTLGLTDDPYRALRRAGINGYFLGNFAAQIALVIGYGRAVTHQRAGSSRWLTGIVIVVPVMALIGEALKVGGVAKNPVNNVVEWNAIVLVCLYYAVVATVWRHHGFAASLHSDSSGGQPASPRS